MRRHIHLLGGQLSLAPLHLSNISVHEHNELYYGWTNKPHIIYLTCNIYTLHILYVQFSFL